MRTLLLCFVLAVSGCISQETQELAKGIHVYQVKQEKALKRIFTAASTGQSVAQKEVDEVLVNQAALVQATGTLSEILGDPDE